MTEKGTLPHFGRTAIAMSFEERLSSDSAYSDLPHTHTSYSTN